MAVFTVLVVKISVSALIKDVNVLIFIKNTVGATSYSITFDIKNTYRTVVKMKNKLVSVLVLSALLVSGCSSNSEKGKASETPIANDSPVGKVDSHAHAKGDGTKSEVDGYSLAILSGDAKSKENFEINLAVYKDGGSINNMIDTHNEKMHLILVNEHLEEYLHVHPTLNKDNTWTAKVKFPTGGKWRIISDFTLQLENDQKQNYILGEEIDVAGNFNEFKLPEPVDMLSVNGYDIKLSGDIKSGEHGMLMVDITKNGEPANLEQYMAALGHLVAIRKEDGAYAHFHPHENMGTMLHFMTEVPGPGTYRLFLQFKADGALNLATFTAVVL